MPKKFFLYITSAICLLSKLVAGQSCISLNSTSIGNQVGTNFSDLEFLIANEDDSFYYRLATMQLCTNSANTLIGMRAIIAKIVTSTNATGSLIPLNRFGAVTETGITCTNATFDYQNSEFVQTMTVFYTSQLITKITLTSSTGRTLSRGLTVTGATSKTLTFTQNQ